jgi:hypothetical protein
MGSNLQLVKEYETIGEQICRLQNTGRRMTVKKDTKTKKKARNETKTINSNNKQFLRRGGIEYLHRSPERSRRRRKGKPVPGVGLYQGHSVLGGYKYEDLALQDAVVSRIGTIKYGIVLQSNADCDVSQDIRIEMNVRPRH